MRSMKKKISTETLPDYIVVPEKGWKTVVDFTDGGKTKRVPIEEVIKEMKKIHTVISELATARFLYRILQP